MVSEIQISPEALKEVEDAFNTYSDEVDRTELSASSKAMYIDHASYFIRWMKYEFHPGTVKNPWPVKSRNVVHKSAKS